jgi:hypothetical protein
MIGTVIKNDLNQVDTGARARMSAASMGMNTRA